MKIATIARNRADSPNMTANDAAILERVAAELTKCGATVVSIGEDVEIPCDIAAVCSMSRSASTIAQLKQAELQGTTVTNTTTAVENCSRERFMEILRKESIPQPPFKTVNKANGLDADCFPCWIKKAKGWSNHKNDVVFAPTMPEGVAAIEEMTARGITECIQMLHCPGDIIKFYGIGNSFFHYSYPVDGKFGKEQINGTPKHYSFDTDKLKSIAQRAAKAVGLDVYGGDAIITPQGDIFIIDLNDFPSFTAIRDIAATEIATLIINKTKHPQYER